MKKNLISGILASLLILMFLYAATSKLMDFQTYERAMHNQPFPDWMAETLIYSIPPLEVVVSLLLFRDRTRLLGFLCSGVLMLSFTIYIAAILLHIFPWVPCSCGGVISQLGWGQHLIFNLSFLTAALWGMRLERQAILADKIT
ncbi:MauE/DoxX family redox-associated membrane protein [Mucilaginibacter sp. Mucisp86]|uniref:MauE/DoxX family redox-associated membrane protein n=1 Tax=Mucilaginibacter sp. Mucisp86 TaxID=3243060 RepID=UPI0039B658CF